MATGCQYTHTGPTAPGWECPHPTADTNSCPLHTEDEPTEAALSTFLQETAVQTEGGTIPAIGARAVTIRVDHLSAPLDLRDAEGQLLAAPDRTVPRLRLDNTRLTGVDLAGTKLPSGLTATDAHIDRLDLSYAQVDGSVDLQQTTLSTLTAEGLDARQPVDLNGATIHEECRLIGARITGGLALTAVTVDGPLLADKLTVDGDLGVADSTVAGLASLRQISVRRECNAAAVRFDNVVTFRGSTLGGTASFVDADFGGEARFDGDTSFGGDARFADATFTRRARFTDARFEGQAVFTGVEFGDLVAFQRTTVEGSLTFSEDTVFDEQADFAGSQFHGPVTFDTAQMAAVELTDVTAAAAVTFANTTVAALRFNDSDLAAVECPQLRCTGRLTMDRCTVDRLSVHNARIDGAVTLRATTVAGDVDAAGTVFGDELDCRQATIGGGIELAPTSDQAGGHNGALGLADARVERFVYQDRPLTTSISADAARFDEVVIRPPRVTPDATVALTDATVMSGHLDQPESGTLQYDLRGATLGAVELAPGPSADPFDPYWLLEPTFDGFRFTDHRAMLTAADWTIHGTPPDVQPTPTQLETTYLAAKNGAANTGDHPAAAVFFVREMRHRRAGYKHRAAGASLPTRLKLGLARAANRGLDETARYGEAPSRVLATAVVTIGGFAALAAAVGPLALSPGALQEYLLVSLQGFTAFVLGSPRIETSAAIHWLTAVEGFVGAFLIGLFVFALTRSVHR